MTGQECVKIPITDNVLKHFSTSFKAKDHLGEAFDPGHCIRPKYLIHVANQQISVWLGSKGIKHHFHPFSILLQILNSELLLKQFVSSGGKILFCWACQSWSPVSGRLFGASAGSKLDARPSSQGRRFHFRCHRPSLLQKSEFSEKGENICV